jgi:hypothetical protein
VNALQAEINRLLRPVRITVVCDLCGERSVLARTFLGPRSVNLICRNCEAPLVADVTTPDLMAARAR